MVTVRFVWDVSGGASMVKKDEREVWKRVELLEVSEKYRGEVFL